MSFSGSFPTGMAGGLRMAGSSSTRGRIQNGMGSGMSYPSPFFDVAHTYLPATIRQLFLWCRYYFMTNPLINATVFKMSEYPVTDIIIEHKDPQIKALWTDYFQDHLRFRPFQIESGLDYHCYGNALISLSYPLVKYLKCPSCGLTEEARKIRQHWVFSNYEFRLTCPGCHTMGSAIPKDMFLRNPHGVRMMRWNPEDVEITYNELTGAFTYFYSIPQTMKNDVSIGKKDIVESIPQIFIQAMREQKGIVFSQDNLFHLKRPTLAGKDRGWGLPLLLPVLKDTFYLQIMKKAQESILLEHIVPLRILFPQAGSGSSDPYTLVNLTDWREHVGKEIAMWRQDQNYIPIMPLPLGQQTVGGDGKALLMTAEIQQWSDQLLVGMGVPREFIYGGMSYAGTNVSMRMLENAFLGYIMRQKQLARWVMKAVSAYLGWPEARIRFKPFKMADDIQRKALLFQYKQAGLVSDTTILADSDLDIEQENELILGETDRRMVAMKKQQLATAQIQGEAQMIMMQFQVKAQQAQMAAQQAPVAVGEPGGPEGTGPGQGPGGTGGAGGPLPPELQVQAPGGGTVQAGPQPYQQAMQSQLSQGQQMGQQPGMGPNIDIRQLAQQQAMALQGMDPQTKEMALQNLATTYGPELVDLIRQLMAQMGQGGGGQAAGPQVDQRPLPEQRSPRRASASV